MKLNLAPHGPFRVAARAPPSLLATAPPSLRGTKGTPMSQPGGRRTGVSSRGAEGGQGGSAAADRRREEQSALAVQEDGSWQPGQWGRAG